MELLQDQDSQNVDLSDVGLSEFDDTHASVHKPVERLGELASRAAEVDITNLQWEPPAQRVNYITTIFGARVFDLGLTNGESAVLVDVIADALFARAHEVGYRSEVTTATRIEMVEAYMMQGKELKKVSYDFGLPPTAVNGMLTQAKLLVSREVGNPSKNYGDAVKKLAEVRGVTEEEILHPDGRPQEGQTDVPELGDINLEDGALLSPQEVSAVIVRLLKGKPETFQQLVRFLSPENIDAADVRKSSEKELIGELRGALRGHISSFSDLGMSAQDEMLVRRVFGGELSVIGAAILPRAVRDLTLVNGGRSYDRAEKVSDALSAFAVQLSKQIPH